MKKVLIGHRGVGKTSLLRRHQSYFPSIPHFDLDQEIEKITGQSVQSLFTSAGEKEFRDLEQKAYQKIKSENKDYVISLGAGFQINQIDTADTVLYVKRITDQAGRLFLNRPRLNPELSAIEESKKRYFQRDDVYSQRADQVYHLPEGLESENEIEKKILTQKFEITDAYYTLSQDEVSRIESLQKVYSSIELRTDLINSSTIQGLTKKYPQTKWLVSFRTADVFEIEENIAVDWEIYLGEPPSFLQKNVQIYSSHENQIHQAIENLKASGHLKLCPVVTTWADLRTGYEWQQQDPKNRSFLPRSPEGHWLWYRQLCKYLQKINFVRNQTEISDQPSAYEWLVLPAQKPKEWAAVLGSPISFSRTPLEQQSFFEKKSTFVTRIHLSPKEFKNYLNWLRSLGLVYAAVTSPLKESAYDLSADLSPEAKALKSVNTLLMKNKIHGHNTDLAGFTFLMKDFAQADQKTIAVWGGGGTLEMIKKVLPGAFYYSSQTGELREKKLKPPEKIKTLIWAAPRHAQTVFPNDAWGIQQVIDLNYVENSMGLEYAVQKNINYISGLQMFKQQALKQQEYWST